MIWPRLIVPWKRSEEVKAHHALYCLCVCVDGMLTVAITLASKEAYTKTSSKFGCKMSSALLNFWREHWDMGFKWITGVSFGVRSTTFMLAANLKPYRREATNQPPRPLYEAFWWTSLKKKQKQNNQPAAAISNLYLSSSSSFYISYYLFDGAIAAETNNNNKSCWP